VQEYLKSAGERVSAVGSNYKLRAKLIAFRMFVRLQRLIARNVRELFSSNRGISHVYEAHCIDEVSRASVSGPKILTGFGFGLP